MTQDLLTPALEAMTADTPLAIRRYLQRQEAIRANRRTGTAAANEVHQDRLAREAALIEKEARRVLKMRGPGHSEWSIAQVVRHRVKRFHGFTISGRRARRAIKKVGTYSTVPTAALAMLPNRQPGD